MDNEIKNSRIYQKTKTMVLVNQITIQVKHCSKLN